MAKKKSNKTKQAFRTPIVAVLGHVDHGKTTLLDTIRGTHIVNKEAGGITQNTRAHQITSKSGNKITFIDTPGHEAFSAMRSRGTEVTDFVLLVVAADDGIQPQTKESIEFAKATNTPIIVAINKVDIDGVKPTKTKQELSGYGVNIEEYGGDVMVFEISALNNKGIDELIEGIELLAEINELTPNEPEENTLANAYVLESTTDKQLGAVALCILKSGELTQRSVGVTKEDIFKIRAYLDEFQKPVKVVYESDPFWITGIQTPLSTGDIVKFAKDDKTAKQVQSQTKPLPETEESVTPPAEAGALLLQMLTQKKAEDQGLAQKQLNLIVRASSQGTLEAVKVELDKLGDDDRTVNILTATTGDITENDINMADTAKAIVISFQLTTPNKVAKLAKQKGVLVRNYEIIYEMIDELSGALEGLMEPAEEEVEVARARVKKIFTLTNGTIIAGCEVIKGTINRGYKAYVERPSKSTKDSVAEVGRGTISELRVNKDIVKEVKKGQECGIMLNPQVEKMQEGDEIVTYKVEKN